MHKLLLTLFCLFLCSFVSGKECSTSLYGSIRPTDYLLGMFDFSAYPEMFSLQTDPPAANPSVTTNRYLRNEVNVALSKMYAAFLLEYPNISWSFISGGRNFTSQAAIWGRKFGDCAIPPSQMNNTALVVPCCLGILEYSSMPGTSRHHWGTDCDLCSLENEYFESGDGKIIHDWWVKNALKFGFAQPYTSDRAAGYELEKWHWSYIYESRTFTEDWASTFANHLDQYLHRANFTGSSSCGFVAPSFVTTVNPLCKTVDMCGKNWLL